MPRKWYVLRDLSRRNSHETGYKTLREAGVKVFTPMMQTLLTVRGHKVRRDVPVIQDLLFVNESKAVLDSFVAANPRIQYRFLRGHSINDPMTVSDTEMDRFIHAVGKTENPQYYMPGELKPSMYGRQVSIIGGPFCGYEGKLLSIKGLRKRKLIVEIPNFVAVAIEIQPEFIRFV